MLSRFGHFRTFSTIPALPKGMEFTRISVVHGDRKLSNEDLFELVSKRNRSGSPAPKHLRYLFDLSGAKQRCHRDFSKPDQRVIDYVIRAFQPLEPFRQDIELTICCGIFKGMVEPASAAVFNQALGLVNAQAFDVSEACHGFARSVELAYSLFTSGLIRKKILIISPEFPDGETSPTRGCWDMNNDADAEEFFPAVTFGSHASMALLEPSFENDSWSINFFADNKLADRTMTPLPAFVDFLPLKDYDGRSNLAKDKKIVNWRFFDDFRPVGHYVGLLVKHTARVHDLENTLEKDDVMFVHSHSKTFWTKKLGPKIDSHIFHLYPGYGNLSSGSFCVGMHEKYGSAIPPGTRVKWLGAAGGLATSYIEFVAGKKPHMNDDMV